MHYVCNVLTNRMAFASIAATTPFCLAPTTPSSQALRIDARQPAAILHIDFVRGAPRLFRCWRELSASVAGSKRVEFVSLAVPKRGLIWIVIVAVTLAGSISFVPRVAYHLHQECGHRLVRHVRRWHSGAVNIAVQMSWLVDIADVISMKCIASAISVEGHRVRRYVRRRAEL